jgi:oxidase EvaA
LLADEGGPFARWEGSGELGEELLDSYRATEPADVRRALTALDGKDSGNGLRLTTCDLGALPGWQVGRSTIESSDRDQRVGQYAVTASHREVETWDQPLLASDAREHILLVGERRGSVLGFLLHPSAEPGFSKGKQFGPTARTSAIFDGHDDFQQLLESTVPLAVAAHSDEGGRFMQVVSRYEVRVLTDSVARPTDSTLTWVSLGTIEQLARRQGALNNELRSAVSLLLQWV